MPSLSARDLVSLLELVRGMHEVPEALAVHCVTAVRALIGGEVATFSDFDLRTSIAAETSDPAHLVTDEGHEVFERHMNEHPLITHYAKTGDGRAHKSSDFLSQAALRRLPLYNEYIKPFFHTHYQIAIAVRAQPSRVVGLSIARASRDFSERDRLMLDVLRPHIAQAVRHAEAVKTLAMNQAIGRGDDANREVVVVDARGRICSASARAHEWIGRYFGYPRSVNQLHDTIWRWVQDRLQSTTRIDGVPAGEPLVARDGRTRLIVQCMTRGSVRLLLLEQHQTALLERLTRLGLTLREAEVLTWVAEGKANSAVAVITGTAERTVEKHLERIYRKLNVENRTSAAALVHELRRLV